MFMFMGVLLMGVLVIAERLPALPILDLEGLRCIKPRLLLLLLLVWANAAKS